MVRGTFSRPVGGKRRSVAIRTLTWARAVFRRANLKGKPVRVLVENVYLLAVPTDSSKATPEEDEARVQAAKQEKLENAEMMTSEPTSGMSLEDEKKNESFTTSLITKIVDNLQIEVRLGETS